MPVSTQTALSSSIEPQTKAFLQALKDQGGPPIYKLSIQEARAVLSNAQAGAVEKLPVDIEDHTIDGGPSGPVSIRIVRPKGSTDTLPAVMYFHGGGWILGDKDTHDRLIREVAVGANAAVVFVNYTPSPEAKYPTAIEQAYVATKHIAENGASFKIDPKRLAVVGDSVGGNMVAAVTLLAKERGGPAIHYQVLFYPVTDASFETGSYNQFADGPWLTKPAMQWFWDAYAPNENDRKKITASPLQASTEQLKGLPPALIITDENDVLRDEGEAYAHKLSDAGVRVTAVRYLGTIHDFVLLNAISQTPAPRSAINLANTMLRQAFAK